MVGSARVVTNHLSWTPRTVFDEWFFRVTCVSCRFLNCALPINVLLPTTSTGELDEFWVKSGIIDPDQLPGGPFSLKVVLSEGGSLSASDLPLIILAFDLCD